MITPDKAAIGGELFEALTSSQRRLRSLFIGRGTHGGSCAECGMTWVGDGETHRASCLIALNDAALARATS